MNHSKILLYVNPEEVPEVSAFLSRLITYMDPAVDEDELRDLLEAHITDQGGELTLTDAHMIAALARATQFNPKFDTLH